MDFGLARQLDDGEDSRLTRDGAILGSPAYMSPEQIEGLAGKIGPSCDIYSLGVILYELLTGQLPFQGSVASIIGQILSKEPIHPGRLRADLHPRLADICLRAMAKTPVDRFGTMKEFAVALTEFLKTKSDETPDKERDRDRGASDKSSAEKPSPVTTAGEKPSGRSSGLKLVSLELEVTCHCGQRMVAKPQMAGKMVRCPRCAEIVQIPGPRTSGQQQPVACAGCGQRFLAREDLAGKVVKCPVCGKPLTVPRPGIAASLAPQIEVSCVCGQQFLARPDLAGKRVKCTSCGRPLVIPNR
jgi:DNA-directed RNA polymerase subunit RPC12/RpoP